MSNADPWKARLAKSRKRRKAGDLQDVRARLWQALEAAAGLLGNADPQITLRAVHATSQAAAAYVKIIETGELQARLEALEGQIAPEGAA